MPPILIISCSLNPGSRSRVLAEYALVQCRSLHVDAQLIDLRDHDLPICDGATFRANPVAAELRQAIHDAAAVILATPIYNYDVSAATKNLVELTGRDAWQDKIVGFLCAAGGHGSYMSVMGLASSLMLDFRCLIVPRFVYATRDAFADGVLTAPKVQERVTELCQAVERLAAALEHAPAGTSRGSQSLSAS